MSSQQKCSQCFSNFTITHLPHLLPCAHNICEPCLQELQTSNQNVVICEFCQTSHPVAELQGLPYNEGVKLDIPDREEMVEVDGIEEEMRQEDLLESSPQRQQPQAKQLCKLHKIPMDIICINDKLKVCPHCALFGSHKNHAVRRIQDFQKELFEKCQIYKEIQVQKLNNKGIRTQSQIAERIRHKVECKRGELTKQIGVYIESYLQILNELKQSLQQEVNSYLKEVQLYFKKNKTLMRYERAKLKFQKWEKECSNIVSKVQQEDKIDSLIDMYFNSPLELVSEGYIYIQEINKLNDQTQSKISQKIENFRLLIDTELPQLLQKSLRLKKSALTPLSSGIKQTNEDPEVNPFLDCSSSQIDIQSYLFQNASMQVEFSTLTNSWKGHEITSANLQKKMSSPEKGLTSLNSFKEIKEEKGVPLGRYSMKSPKSTSMKNSQIKGSQMRLSKVSESGQLKPNQKLQKNQNATKQLPPQMPKPFDCKEPQKLFAQFMKNTLTDFFDLSDCNMPDQKITQYVYRAKKSHKIKGLKLCSNQLTTEGFEKLSEYLKGVCNINLANNRVDQGIFEVIAKNREKIDSLRILNLSHNPINLDKKARARFEEIKRMGVIVIL